MATLYVDNFLQKAENSTFFQVALFTFVHIAYLSFYLTEMGFSKEVGKKFFIL